MIEDTISIVKQLVIVTIFVLLFRGCVGLVIS
jgi:hypothetical protein